MCPDTDRRIDRELHKRETQNEKRKTRDAKRETQKERCKKRDAKREMQKERYKNRDTKERYKRALEKEQLKHTQGLRVHALRT